jgi:FMN reductase
LLLDGQTDNAYIQGGDLRPKTMSNPPMKILGLAGEYRATSKSGMLVNAALNLAKANGAEVHFWDLAEKPLPMVGEEGCWSHPNVKEFQDLLTSCDAFFLSSPEYHGTMSGVMKNTLDWMYDKHVGGKVFGLMSTLGGVTNANTLNHMRIALRWLHAWPVPEQLAVGHVKEAFDDDGSLLDEGLNERLLALVEAVMTASTKLRASP